MPVIIGDAYRGSIHELKTIAGSTVTYNSVGGPVSCDPVNRTQGTFNAAASFVQLDLMNAKFNSTIKFSMATGENVDITYTGELFDFAGIFFSATPLTGGSGTAIGTCTGGVCATMTALSGAFGGSVVGPNGEGVIANYLATGGSFTANGVQAFQR